MMRGLSDARGLVVTRRLFPYLRFEPDRDTGAISFVDWIYFPKARIKTKAGAVPCMMREVNQTSD